MTKKHFIAMAKVLNDYNRRNVEISTLHNTNQFKNLINDLMLVFEDSNPQFDRSRFIDAVYDGVEE
jgi:hypothetical protein